MDNDRPRASRLTLGVKAALTAMARGATEAEAAGIGVDRIQMALGHCPETRKFNDELKRKAASKGK